MGLAAAFLLCNGMRPAAGVQLAPDCGEHPLRHVQIAADLAFVDLERQVGGVARFDIQVVERGALVQIFGERVRVLLDGLPAQVGQVVAVVMPAGAVEQVALERFLDRLLAVEGDVVIVAAVGQQQARALQVTQRLVQPLVVEMAVRRACRVPCAPMSASAAKPGARASAA